MTVIPSYAMERLGICRKTYYNWLNTLIKKGIIQRIDRYRYVLKPYIAVKGEMRKANENTFRIIRNRELTSNSQ